MNELEREEKVKMLYEGLAHIMSHVVRTQRDEMLATARRIRKHKLFTNFEEHAKYFDSLVTILDNQMGHYRASMAEIVELRAMPERPFKSFEVGVAYDSAYIERLRLTMAEMKERLPIGADIIISPEGHYQCVKLIQKHGGGT